MIQSPLNYTGGKYKLLPQLLPLFPKQINTFVDLFCGGCNVGINVEANAHIYNDCSTPLIELYTVMQTMDSEEFITRVYEIIRQYELSLVSENGYDYYGCQGSVGLSTYNKEKYLRLRTDFNTLQVRDEEYYVRLYVLIVYTFNNQIRFNSNGEFNLPVGKRDFNIRMKNKLAAFMNRIQSQNCVFSNVNFRDFDIARLTPNDFVYADPPYLITCASYNEQGGWTEEKERELLELLDTLSERHIRFALSNVLESKGVRNNILTEWLQQKPDYRMVPLDYTYQNSNYQRTRENVYSQEVLILNY